jgi:hypothetical protein
VRKGVPREIPRYTSRAVAALLALFLLAPSAHAHRGSTTYVQVEPLEAGARVEVEIEVVDAAVQVGLPEDASADAVLARSDEVQAWIGDGVHLRGAGGPCEPSLLGSPTLLLDGAGVARLRIELAFACPAPVTGLVLRDDTVFSTDPQHETYVRLRFGEGEETLVLRLDRQEGRIGAASSVPALAWRFLVLGAEHLLTGYDHLLFLLALLLTSGGVAVKEGRRKALRDVVLVVTAFTIGHSVTLVLAALELVTLPPRPVEIVIALSIAVVALLNILRDEARGHVPWLALGFGLVHGLGFSGVLGELGLPSRARLVSLFSFNLGIELAQLALVGLAILPLEWAARRPGYRRWVVQAGSLAIAALALLWTWERWTAG